MCSHEEVCLCVCVWNDMSSAANAIIIQQSKLKKKYDSHTVELCTYVYHNEEI